MRLIDKDALKVKAEHIIGINGSSDAWHILSEIDHAEEIDAEPVRHGRWETDGMPMDDGEYLMTRCTVCGTAYEYGHNENYCGYCGAKMDEVEQNE